MAFEKIKWILIVSILTLSLPPGAFADETSLSWTDCLTQARANNPDLEQARQSIQVARANKSLSQSARLPTVTSSLSADTTKSSGQDRSESYAYGVTAKQLLFDGLKSSHDVRAAIKNVEAAEYAYKVSSSNVRMELRQAFVSLLYAQENIQVLKTIADRRQANLDMVKLQYDSGRENKGALMQAQANWENAEADKKAAARQLYLAQRQLSRIMGQKKFYPMTVKGDLNLEDQPGDMPDFDQMVNDVPLLKQLSALKEAAVQDKKSAVADFFPSVYADAGAGRSGSEWAPRQQSLSAGITVNLPFFQGGAQQAQLSKSKAAMAQAIAKERSGKDSIVYTLALTWVAWQNSMDEAAVQQKYVQAASERVRIADVQYRSGLLAFNNWIIIEDAYANTQKAGLNAWRDVLFAKATWEQAKGVTVDEE